MTGNWQDLVVFALIGLALVDLARRARGILARRAARGCASGCGGCPAARRAAKLGGLVTLEARNHPAPGR